MKIHGIVWMIFGGFIVGFSYYISGINDKIDIQKFMLFIWLGWAFLAYGLLKLLFWVGSFPRKQKIAKENYHHMPNAHSNRQLDQHKAEKQLLKFCSNCGSAVRHFDNFCYKCGSRMFKK